LVEHISVAMAPLGVSVSVANGKVTHLILSDQAPGAFGEKHFMAELDRVRTLPRLMRSVCGSKIE
jgi:hypothetical protein